MKRTIAALVITACVLAQAVVFMPSARAQTDARTRYDFHITLPEAGQALNVYQLVSYTNRTGAPLSRIMFQMQANVFRRESTLPYDNASLEKAFPYGYAPGGIEFHSVLVNGEPADWGVQGENEAYLRVECALENGEECEIAFVYTLLITENCAFLGMNDTDWRFTGFYPSVCPFENGDFVLNPITRAGESAYSDIADFYAEVHLPVDYVLAAGGRVSHLPGAEDGRYHGYRVEITGAREFAFAASRKFHEKSAEMGSVRISALGQKRSDLRKACDEAERTLAFLEDALGPYPWETLTIVFCDMAEDSLSASGLILISGENVDSLSRTVPALVCRQYFGEIISPNPANEAWMIEGLSEYAALLMLEETEGEAAFAAALNERILPSLQITVPGGLLPHMETRFFITHTDYETVVRERGCAVFHELRIAMGRELFLQSLKEYYETYAHLNPTAEELIEAMNRAAGGEWRNAVYSWLNTIGDYQGEYLESYQ